jgi:type I restriction enzyme S subunit
MDLSTFFQKFDLFADAPDAVAKMRELVLELAVRGQLSERRSSDQDDPVWSAFREKIDNRIYGSDPGPPPPFDIPDEWRWVQLAEAADCRASAKVDSASLKDSDWVLDLEDIDGGAGKVIATATFAERRSLSTKASFEKGDVLYGKLRPYLNKVVIAERSGFCTTEIIPLRPQPFVAAGYLRFFLRSQTFLRYAAEKNYGMKMPRLGTKDLESAEIPLPPLAEQKRIVAKVDELMALCDRLEAQQQERETRHAALAHASLARFAEAPAPANLAWIFHPSYTIPSADLRKAILTLAVQGKLVPQDPNDEPAEDSLSRLGLKSTISGGEIEDDSLPQAWVRVRFEDVAFVAGGVTLGRKLGHRKTVTLPYLRVANVKRGEIDLTVIKEVSIADDEIERYALRENDLLMTEGGDWDKVGRAAIWRAEIPVCLHQNHVFRARMRSSEIMPFWFERYFNSPVGRGYFESASKQTTNLASINMRQVRNCPIPLPPLAEQRRIVAKVDQLMALVDDLERQLAASRATAEKLLSALVAELTTS